MAPPLNEAEREAQAAYWREQSAAAGASVEAMMLDSLAAALDAKERPEILKMLPPVAGKTVVEFGSGIGRFTGDLAAEALHVTAVDFMEHLVAKNAEKNGKRSNVTLLCADVTAPTVQFEQESIDLLFSNWLFMYLSNDEVEILGRKVLGWLKPGGSLFFRESCFHQSGDSKRKSNPTHYREPLFYTQAFKKLRLKDDNGDTWQLSLQKFCCVPAYVRLKRSQNQVCWLWQKIRLEDSPEGSATLDEGQYSVKGILKYERIFGAGFVSTGGIDTTRELVAQLDLKPGERVLDIGSGLGGSALYMAQHDGADVTGIDLSVNMISLAIERAIGSQCHVEYELADCTKKEYPEGTFDVVYSRDTILHIHDKLALFRRILKWLKPRGRLLITDYCCGDITRASPEFRAYVTQRGYDLHQVADYGRMLEKAGFEEVKAEDTTNQFVAILENELRRTEEEKDTFIAEFSQAGYEDIVSGWKAKLARCAQGEQKWGLFTARKPA